jgi:S1-C subfamily serine protease
MVVGTRRRGWRLLLPVLSLLYLPHLAAPAAAQQAGLLRQIEEERAEVLETAQAGVVRIHAIYAQGSQGDGQKLGQGFTHGTGFIIDEAGHILTVEEAVRGADEIRVTLSSGVQVPARFVGSDRASEVALIQVAADDVHPVALGDSDRLRVGHFAFILGNSFGNLAPSLGFAQHVDRAQDLIHIRAPIQPSYGGAPVFGSSGEVIGMVWAAVDPWAGLRASGQIPGPSPMAWQEIPTTVYVVPINRAMRIAKQLTGDGRPVYGYLGIQGEIDPDGGVRVVDVAPDGPAASSGIGPGDRILAYNGSPVLSLWHFIYMVMTTAPGAEATVQVVRDGKPSAARVTVGRMEQEVFAEIAAQMQALQTPLQARRTPGGPLAKPVGEAADSGMPGFSQEAGDVFQQIDRLEREIWRLREQLMQQAAP